MQETVVNSVRKYFNFKQTELISSELKRVIHGQGTIFAFGNGGSEAFAQHLCMSLRDTLPNEQFKLFENPPIYYTAAISNRKDYDNALAEFLKRNYDKKSLVFLISASGNSKNIILAAKTAKRLGLKTVSFTGFSGGKLKALTDYSINSEIDDQQPAEDNNQIILHLILLLTKLKLENKKSRFKSIMDKYLEDLSKNLKKINPSFINTLSNKIVDDYIKNKKVFIYAPEGGSLSISADHIAHNLQWDAISKVYNPPDVQINAALLSQQYTGIANDRKGYYVYGLQIRISANEGNLLLIFARNCSSKAVKYTILDALEKKLEVFIITNRGQAFKFKKAQIMELDISNEMLFSDIIQIIGHIIGRIVRAKLLIINKQLKGNPLAFLIEEDLAQLRIKGDANTLLDRRYKRLEKKWKK